MWSQTVVDIHPSQKVMTTTRLVPKNSDEVEDVYDTTANFMASGDANDASLLEDGDYDIYDTYDLDGLNNVQRALCEAFDINLRGKLRR
ncbi:hypothetical protein Tco_0021873 [Tanacetum coccineum]